MNDIVILKFLFHENFSILTDAIASTVEKGGIEVEEAITSKETATILASYSGGGIVFASLKTKEDMMQIASFMKKESKMMASSNYKFIVIDYANNKEFTSILSKMTITEIMKPDIQLRALKHKLNLWLTPFLEKKKNTQKNEEQTVKKTEVQQEKPTPKKETDSIKLNWQDPLKLEDDIWIIKDANDCKNILSNWLVRITGPSPAIGKWKKEKENEWRYVIVEKEKNLFTPGDGNWFFQGEQTPEFKWDENIWIFKGSQFEIFFLGSKGRFSRIKVNSNKTADVAKNSVYAQKKEQLILDSFKMELIVDKSDLPLGEELSAILENKTSEELSVEIEDNRIGEELETKIDKVDSIDLNFEEENKRTEDDELSYDNKKDKEKSNLLEINLDNEESGTLNYEINSEKSKSTTDDYNDSNDSNIESLNLIPIDQAKKLMVGPRLEASIELNNILVTCSLYDYFDSCLIISIEDQKIEKNASVKMKLDYTLSGDVGTFEMDGLILEVENQNEGCYAMVRINSDDPEFELFMLRYQICQSEISELFLMARGA